MARFELNLPQDTEKINFLSTSGKYSDGGIGLDDVTLVAGLCKGNFPIVKSFSIHICYVIHTIVIYLLQFFGKLKIKFEFLGWKKNGKRESSRTQYVNGRGKKIEKDKVYYQPIKTHQLIFTRITACTEFKTNKCRIIIGGICHQ